MKRARVYINLGIFTVGFVGMLFWAIGSVVSVDQVDRPYRLTGDFVNAFGIGPDAEVTYLGVPSGTVTSVHRIPGGVRVSMKIRRTYRIPKGSTANIGRKSAIGEPYVDFEPPPGYTGGGAVYRNGDRVPLADTTVPLEFSELLRSASALISSLPPADVERLLHEAAVGLNGRTDSLREMAEAGDKLSADLAQRTEVLDRLATNNTRITHVVTQHRESLGQSLTDLRQLAETLRNAQGDTSVLLDRGSQLLGLTADIVSRQKANLDCDLKTLAEVTDVATTPTQLTGLRALLDISPRAFAGVFDATDVEPGFVNGDPGGRWVRVGLIQNSTNPPKQYVPAKTTPAERPTPACTSALRPTGIDYRPLAAGSGASGAVMLPSTGAGATGLAGLGGLVGFVGLRWLRLRSAR